MTLIVKIMSGEDIADDNPQKSFKLITGVEHIEFHRRIGAPVARISVADEPESFELDLDGNVYVMNANGKTVASFAYAQPWPEAAEGSAPPDRIAQMVDRFLAWKLPEDFRPDGGITFKVELNEDTDHPMRHEPSGTNLFDYRQAEAMVRHMVEGL